VVGGLQCQRALDLLPEPTLRGPPTGADRAGHGLVQAFGDCLLPTLAGYANPSVEPDAKTEVGSQHTAEVVDGLGVVVVVTEEHVVRAATGQHSGATSRRMLRTTTRASYGVILFRCSNVLDDRASQRLPQQP
jgi:hypothetical protein